MGAPVYVDDQGNYYDENQNPVDADGNPIQSQNVGAAAQGGDMASIIEAMLQQGYGQPSSTPAFNPETLPLNQAASKAASGYTFPLANVTKLQSQEKGAASLMGVNPIQDYAGAKFKPYVAQTDSVLSEAQGDPIGDKLLADWQNGKSPMAMKAAIQSLTAKKGDSTDDTHPISYEMSNQWSAWVDRLAKAHTADTTEQMKREQQSTLGDAESNVPTDQSKNFDVNQWLGQRAAAGDFGTAGSDQFQGMQHSQQAVAQKADLPSWSGGNPAAAGHFTGPAAGLNESGAEADANVIARMRMNSAKAQADRSLQSAVTASPAKQRSLRAIQAYRLLMGLNPNG